MTDVTDTGAGSPGTEQRAARGPRARTVRLVTIVLALVLVVALAAAIWLGLEARSKDQQRKERAAAANVASQFALRMDSVDGEDFENYLKSITELMSTKAKTKNKQAFDAIRDSYKTAKVKGEGKVLLTAVGDADEDSATVLVVHDQDVTTTQGKIEHHYRWSVDMVKVKDAWLVDDFNPVN